MGASRSSAATERPPAQNGEPAVEESLAAHTRRVLRARMTAAAVRVLDPGIALLQRLRTAAGGTQDADKPAAEPAAPAPAPRRRMLVVCVGALLVGGAGGAALSFKLWENMLVHMAAEYRLLEGELSAQSDTAAAARRELDQANAARGDAEKKLAALRAEQANSAGRQEAITKLTPQPDVARLTDTRAPQPAGRQAPPPKPVDCQVIAGNDVSALMDCIHRFNR
ncbi:MAG: hypothetical protein WAO95_05315 [Burkholderiales bacterium]